MKTVLSFSGGLDSTTLLYWLKAAGNDVLALSFDYGQRHRRELRAAQEICKRIDVPHLVVMLPRLFSENGALTGTESVPHGHYTDENQRVTVVPGRNLVFASLATATALKYGAGQVAMAVHAGDHAIYPDCRPGFVDAMRAVMRACDETQVILVAPFLHWTKRDIALEARRLNVPVELTWTCYEGRDEPCGKCGACVERNEALA